MKKMPQPVYSSKAVRILAQTPCHRGFFSVNTYQLQYRRFDGEWSIPIERELFERDAVAAVLPYDPKRDQVVLIEQFRAGCIHGDESPWLFEIVAGIVEKGETAAEMAVRETQEEAGLAIEKLLPIYDYWTSPGGSTEYLSLYCAIVDAGNAGGIHGAAHEQEDIKVHVIDCDTAFEAVRQNQVRNATTIIALQWLALHKAEL